MRLLNLFVVPSLVLAFAAACGSEKKDSAPSEAPKAVTPASAVVPAPTPTPAPPPAAPTGPAPSEAKEFLGLDLQPLGAWKPVWDPDAKVAKWENEEAMVSIVIRVVKDKLDTIDDLKAAAAMMMQLGEALTETGPVTKTDKGWWSVVKRNEQTDLIYVQKHGGVQIVCSGDLDKQDLGTTLDQKTALDACESIKVKP
jgi:hypothetical protein